MTKQEASKRYSIPIELLEKYERYFHSVSYGDEDLERLSMIMTLYDAGFDDSETERYIRLHIYGKDTEKERIEMLTKKRNDTLDDIHLKQKRLDSLDYLRYKILHKS